MNVEENLKIIDVFIDAFNKREWDRVANLHAESVVYWTPDNTEPDPDNFLWTRPHGDRFSAGLAEAFEACSPL